MSHIRQPCCAFHDDVSRHGHHDKTKWSISSRQGDRTSRSSKLVVMAMMVLFHDYEQHDLFIAFMTFYPAVR